MCFQKKKTCSLHAHLKTSLVMCMERFLFKSRIAWLIMLLSISYQWVAAQNSPVRERLLLDNGWRFYLGDITPPVIKGHNESYNNAKAGKAWGAAAPEYNDNQWRLLNLPHDWAVEQGFDSTENLSQGYRKRGIGWYRRHFKLSPADKGKHLELQFDGIATYCSVWFNGNLVHRNWCGYTSFYIDITSMAKFGEETNSIAIRVDANAMEGWWYEGAGMYRHTWLLKRNPVHITTNGVFAHPVKLQPQKWQIPVSVALQNIGQLPQNVKVTTALYSPKNELVTSATTQATVASLDKQTAQLNLLVNNPLLWSIHQPTLYKVVTTVENGNQKIDTLVTKCGFRTTRFTADSGFFLNDEPVKLQGVCNHQDHAGVGVAVPDALWAFRLKKLKEMGVNAYRCSHNPPAAEFLEACDSLGIMVMDENRNFNVSPEYVQQLEWMVLRDRNHPSIILWSVFNEEPMQGTEQGYEMVRRMSAIVKKLDTTRPITAAMNGGLFSPINVSKAVDVVGFNYQIGSYDRFHKENPTLKLTSSEDVSAFQVRGEYVNNPAKHILNSYDTERAPWGSTHRVGWKAIAERPYLAGGFVWTGFDYRGEPTPYKWPSAGSFFGIMDLCGFPKMAFWLHQAQWLHNQPVLQLVPHWNWPTDSIGKNIKVMALSNADSVTLWLNGKLIGGQKVDKYEMNTWQVPYKPGKLEAIGYKLGKQIAKYQVSTTGNPVAVQLVADRPNVAGDGEDAMPVTVKVVDAQGREVPTANHSVVFEISNNANIIGLGNGDPNSHEPEKGNQRSLFNGLAQVIIQTKPNTDGEVVLKANVAGLQSATLRLPIRKSESRPSVPVVFSPMFLSQWRISPFSNAKPNATVTISDNDMNSWLPAKTAELVTFNDGNYALFNTKFTLSNYAANTKGKIVAKKITGKAEFWLNNQLIGTKNTAQPADIVLPFTANNGNYTLTILIEGEMGKKAGLGGTVAVHTQTD